MKIKNAAAKQDVHANIVTVLVQKAVDVQIASVAKGQKQKLKSQALF